MPLTDGQLRDRLQPLLAEAGSPESAEALSRRAEGRLAVLKSRTPGRPKIVIAREGGRASIDVVNDDMPFLVDSTLALLNDRGIEITLFIHPVVQVVRDAGGALTEIVDGPLLAQGAARESLMYFETGPLPDTLEAGLASALADVRAAVLDWRQMTQRIRDAAAELAANPPPAPMEELTESIAFLEWLADNHFTLLGARAPGQPGFGVLRDPGQRPMNAAALPGRPPLITVAKSGLRSQVHRRITMDYIGVALADQAGAPAGSLELVGLFTSNAYTQSPSNIPLIRRKIAAVVAASGYPPQSHSGKALMHVLETYPRDELFQIGAAALATIASGILKLEERPRARLFVRDDAFGRFVSAFVFVPRDRFNSDVRQRIGAALAKAYGGRILSFAPFFGETPLVRVHYMVERAAAAEPDQAALETAVADICLSWDDRLARAFDVVGEGRAADVLSHWQGAFPPGYRETADFAMVLKDISELEGALARGGIGAEFLALPDEPAAACHLRLYRWGQAIPLSDRLPVLESMGFRSISETTYALTPQGGGATIHDVALETASGAPAELAVRQALLEEVFLAVWAGTVENDDFNALVLTQGMSAREASILRALARYLRQARATYTGEYIAQTLVKHGEIALLLLGLFEARFHPQNHDARRAIEFAAEIEVALAAVTVLDEDRIIRRMSNLIQSILRTNAYQTGEGGGARPALSFKIASRQVMELPDPKPFAEIFVYAPEMEGVHLRMGPIARGGLRWSDRSEDFRTEVLGLVKAQNVKNSVIVPVGAKGGFVPKRLPKGGTREEIQKEGTAAYRLFVQSLIDLTDNLETSPANTVAHDGNDPYLVVAADKGTATFSDTANGLSEASGFWLADAFASGGSAGYDHKKMAITARGAWEAVKRHFREMGRDTQGEPFTVIGVGDMSGDVFGNGMLLSEHIRLIAAFDHRDIFIDPEPDAQASFAERKRMFALPRSSWADYDKKLISPGGGVFSRGLKSIPLSPEMKQIAGLDAEEATPQELMRALLGAPCDLLWFGGIGTYVKAAAESHADTGDKANDAIRVDGEELRALAVGEGANLGLTQRGRIAYALRGGRINTDAVDNSAGVNSSDIEVNLKIALGAAEAKRRLTRAGRNALLESMTGDVAAAVLRNNYLQTLCLSLARAQGSEENGQAIALMRDLGKRGLLDRKLEALPSDDEVAARDARGGFVTRPEWSVLMAYAKLTLKNDLLQSDVPSDPYLARELVRYFPERLRAEYAEEIETHRLRREIIATGLANSMINRGGPAFAVRLAGETGATPARVAAAYAAARHSFGFPELNALADTFDGKLNGDTQLVIYAELQRYLRWSTAWFSRQERFDGGLSALIERYRSGIAEVADYLTAHPDPAVESRTAALADLGVPAEAARRFAIQRPLQLAPDAVKIARDAGIPVAKAAATVFSAFAALKVARIASRAGDLNAKDLIERRAIGRLISSLFQSFRAITRQAIAEHGAEADPWAAWSAAHAAALEHAQAELDGIAAGPAFDLARLAVAQGVLGDL